MIHSIQFTCVLDTNVIYPIDVRDLLFWFAHHELYTPKWSKHIFDEWKNVMLKKEVPEDEAEKRIHKAQLAFPDALVQNYETLIDGLHLPDAKDRHVMAVAIKVNADLIITNNLKDFPGEYLAQYGLKAKSADDFITDIIDLNQETPILAFRDLVLNRTNPILDEYQILDRFRNNGLNVSANYIHTLI